MALVFAGATALGVYGVVHGLTRRQVRSGLALVVVTTGVCAYGLWTTAAWGRNLGIVLALANGGVGALTLLNAIVFKTSPLAPAVVFAVSVSIAYALTRPWFTLPGDKA
jgi:hypothetical protein